MDATTQRLGQMLRQIEESRSFLQNLLDAAPDPVLVIDSDYRIVLSNRAYDRMLGTPPQGVAGLPCHQVSRGLREPCPATIVRCPLAELRTSAEPMRTVMTLKRADGSDVSVEIHAAPVTAADGRRLIFEVIRPLDAQVRFSQEQRLSAVGLLANGVAHEIRNPLASIRLALQSCLRGLRERTLDSAEITEYLELVDQEIDRCVLTTQRLLALSEPPGDSRAVRLALAIDDVRALLAAEADSAKVRIELDLQPADAAVLADEAELRQVILNLMQNAFHAMPQGGRLAISLRRHGAFLRLSISDEGVGIAPEDLSLIFLPFFSRRADGRRGTGLGLAICKAMVERHGGRIAVDSQVGRGSTFSVELRAANEEGS
jgi:PAS domain S-box-containing protein